MELQELQDRISELEYELSLWAKGDRAICPKCGSVYARVEIRDRLLGYKFQNAHMRCPECGRAASYGIGGESEDSK